MRNCAFMPYVEKMISRTDLRIVHSLYCHTGYIIDLAREKTELCRRVIITRDLESCLVFSSLSIHHDTVLGLELIRENFKDAESWKKKIIALNSPSSCSSEDFTW